MQKEKDEAGVKAVAIKAMDQDATPNANAPTTTRPARLQTLLPTLTHLNRGQFELLSLPPIPNTASDGKTTPPLPLSPPWLAGYTNQWSTSPATTASDGDPPIRTPQQKTSAHRFYCALHGLNITHNGVNYTHMLRDPTTYSERHLNAKQPSDCANPAGNDHIRYIRPPPRLH